MPTLTASKAEIMLYLLRLLRDMRRPPRRDELIKMVAEDLGVTEDLVIEAIKDAEPVLREYAGRPE